jgi:hypothetical protein
MAGYLTCPIISFSAGGTSNVAEETIDVPLCNQPRLSL